MGPRLSSGRGVEGPRSASCSPADVRTPERHPAVRRSREGPVDRGAHPAGIAGGGLGLLRFLVLYNFSLPKKALTPSQVESAARAIPSASREEQEVAYRKFVFERMGAKASFLLARIALDHGVEAAGHLAVRASLDDLGRLGHNLALAVGYADFASVLGLPRGLVPIANLGQLQSVGLQSVPPGEIPPLDRSRSAEADGEALAALLDEWEFDRVEPILRAFASEGKADQAYRPLLVAASATQ